MALLLTVWMFSLPATMQIPVYLSKTLAENLYVLQYPVKSSASTFDDGQVVNCCVKPINQQVKTGLEHVQSVYLNLLRSDSNSYSYRALIFHQLDIKL